VLYGVNTGYGETKDRKSMICFETGCNDKYFVWKGALKSNEMNTHTYSCRKEKKQPTSSPARHTRTITGFSTTSFRCHDHIPPPFREDQQSFPRSRTVVTASACATHRTVVLVVKPGTQCRVPQSFLLGFLGRFRCGFLHDETLALVWSDCDVLDIRLTC
jgi:hypothetical protein